MLKCSSLQVGLVSLHGATDLLNSKRFDIITVSQLYAVPACVLRVALPSKLKAQTDRPFCQANP